ncbi:hypothetical protein BC941DRAFT_420644 [Chlamydoabsidia padenii]|nr:hypothetical protein BC941DRAFT_420644 [Chlamydoabsidia padenii]
MTDHENSHSPIDRSKRPRLEEEVDSDYEPRGEEDRHPKRQAVPDPETKAPHFAGDEKNKNDAERSDQDDNGGNTTVQVSLRSLVGTKDAGIIIGRGGKNVNEIREYSYARVTVSGNVPGAFERILTVNGSVDSVAKAYSMVGEKILAEASPDDQDKQDTAVSIRLLVPDFRMGNLIGRSGSIIKSIQEESGARLNASEEPLPMSTDRTMTIYGSPKSICLAVARIASILAEQSAQSGAKHIPFVPLATNSSAGRSGYPMRNGGGVMNTYGIMPVMGMPMGSPYFYQGGGNYGGGHQGGRSPDYGNMTMNTNHSQQIFIPNEMVGCIIGKGGSKINEIRQISGSHIKIMDPTNDTNDRLITVTGTHETNNMALYLLYSRLETEKARLGRM